MTPTMTVMEPQYLVTLNKPQLDAALAVDGPIIVLAGAGSGKTKMLTARVSHLIEGHGVAPYRILAVTFTNKAAGEMRERIERSLTGSTFGAPEIGTFHAVCVRLLRREADRLPFTKPFVIYDDSDQLALIKETLRKLDIDPKALNPKAVHAAIDRWKCDAVEPAEALALAAFEDRHFAKVYDAYQKALVTNNAVDFGEILFLAYRLLRDHSDIRSKYQERWQYLHVDEYQDTNRVQYLLLSMLASSKHGGHENLCVVGDEDQSIYKWRGADIHNILDFERDFPGARVVKLEQNYRSTKAIITAASGLIRNNSQRKEKSLWTDNEEGRPLSRVQFTDERAEAEWVVSEIKRLAADEGYAFPDFSVFYRTHAQSRQFEDVLRREKITYQVVGGLRFYDRKEIKDVLAYFRVLLNPSDTVSLKRIVNEPPRGIGKTTLERIDALVGAGDAEGGAAGDLWSALVEASSGCNPDFTPRASGKLKDFITLLDRLSEERPRLLLSELYHKLLEEVGYVKELKREGSVESLARIENLEELDSVIQEFEEEILGTMPETERETAKATLLELFIERSSLATDYGKAQDPSSVKLMTLHSSKGLEFPVVFLVGMEEGLFPSIRPWEETDPEDIEEERRLCYVGMTRARKALYLTGAVARRIWGSFSYQEPSRFFQEIPEELIHFQDLSFTRPSGTRPSEISDRPRLKLVASHVRHDVHQATGTLAGTKISHPSFGLGTILHSEGAGSSMKVTVEFSGRVRRKFLYSFVEGFLRHNGG